MSQLNVKVEIEQLEALRRFADQRHTPIAALIRDYISYLVAGGEPVVPPVDKLPSAVEIATLAERGGSFDWLAKEPELYTLDDGEPV